MESSRKVSNEQYNQKEAANSLLGFAKILETNATKTTGKMDKSVYLERIQRMREYIRTHDVELPPSKYEILDPQWLLSQMPPTLLRNKTHLLHVRNRVTNDYYVICYSARLLRVKRAHGKLRTVLSPHGYRQTKFITRSSGVEEFHDFVPEWVRTKPERESFASLFGVFIKGPSRDKFVEKKRKIDSRRKPKGPPSDDQNFSGNQLFMYKDKKKEDETEDEDESENEQENEHENEPEHEFFESEFTGSEPSSEEGPKSTKRKMEDRKLESMNKRPARETILPPLQFSLAPPTSNILPPPEKLVLFLITQTNNYEIDRFFLCENQKKIVVQRTGSLDPEPENIIEYVNYRPPNNINSGDIVLLKDGIILTEGFEKFSFYTPPRILAPFEKDPKRIPIGRKGKFYVNLPNSVQANVGEFILAGEKFGEPVAISFLEVIRNASLFERVVGITLEQSTMFSESETQTKKNRVLVYAFYVDTNIIYDSVFKDILEIQAQCATLRYSFLEKRAQEIQHEMDFFKTYLSFKQSQYKPIEKEKEKVWNIPDVPFFIGRTSQLRTLEEHFSFPTIIPQKRRIFWLSGLPFIGKSTLLYHYLNEIKNKINLAWVIKFTSFYQDFIRLASHLGYTIPQEANPLSLIQFIFNYLSNQPSSNWIIVFDNIPLEDANFLLQNIGAFQNGNIVFVTQSKVLNSLQKEFKLSSQEQGALTLSYFTTEEAIEFIQTTTGEKGCDQKMTTIAQKLDNHPYALQRLSEFITHQKQSFSQFYNSFEVNEKSLLLFSKPPAESITTVIQKFLKEFQSNYPKQFETLLTLAFVEPKNIPLIFFAWTNESSQTFQLLSDHYFIHLDVYENQLSIPYLIQTIIRTYFISNIPDFLYVLINNVTVIASDILNKLPRNYLSWTPHFEKLIEYSKQYGVDASKLIDLVKKLQEI